MATLSWSFPVQTIKLKQTLTILKWEEIVFYLLFYRHREESAVKVPVRTNNDVDQREPKWEP